MKKTCSSLFLSFVLLFGLIGCSDSDSSKSGNDTNGAQSLETPALDRVDFMTGLQNPWDLAFLPDGTMFFSERCKGLSVRKTDGSVVRLFGTSGSALVATDLFCEGQSGANGVAIDPNFASNRLIYLFMSSNQGSGPKTNRVVRLTVNSDFTSVSQRTDVVTDMAYKNSANNWGAAGSHSGGRLRFGPDGFLYITTGDNHNGTLPQDLTRLGGKVLRVDRDGVAAPGNNTPAGGDPRIFAFGFRNPQGLTFRPGSGRPFIAEHGPGHSDEVTALSAGGNGGWDPKPDPGVTCADNYCGYISNRLDGTPTRMTDTEKFPQALPPTYQVPDSAGMGPATFLVGSQWKAWEGALLVGIMANKNLTILRLASETSVADVQSAADLPPARMRSLVQGPDGALYIATDEGAIWKVTPR